MNENVIPIGTKEDGETLFQDFRLIPHFFVCGYSGAGKTAFVQSVVTSAISRYTPETLQLFFFDSKQVDYVVFRSIPHLLLPITTKEQVAKGFLSWLSAKTRMRLSLLAEGSARDITAYNKGCVDSNDQILPHIFAIFDDFSSLSLDNDEIKLVLDILKNGRPAGIHLVVVTSQIVPKTLPKEILASIPCRISFRVPSKADSRLAIGQCGAELLRSPGEFLFQWQDAPVKCQTIFRSDEDIKKTVAPLQVQNNGDSATAFDEQPFRCATPPQDLSEEPITDDSFWDAMELAIDTQNISTSMLQTRLGLGYARAARIVGMMEQRGFIGEFDSLTKKRKILITQEELTEMIKNSKKTES